VAELLAPLSRLQTLDLQEQRLGVADFEAVCKTTTLRVSRGMGGGEEAGAASNSSSCM